MYVLKESQPTLFEEKVYLSKYSILINLPKRIEDEVRTFKKKLSHLIGPYDAVHSLAHISILQFICVAEQEDKLIRELASFGLNEKRIRVHLRNFNRFDNSRTLFIDLENKEGLIKLYQNLCLHLKVHMKGMKGNFKSSLNPHVTIGKNLSHYQFSLSVEEFLTNQYEKNFICSHLTLLKSCFDHRHERDYWVKVWEFPLGRADSGRNIIAEKKQKTEYPIFQDQNNDYDITFSVSGPTLADFLLPENNQKSRVAATVW